MNTLIIIIGCIILTAGIVSIAMPQKMRDFLTFAKYGRRVYLGGMIRLIFGCLLLIASPHSYVFWIPAIVGTVMAISGILIFMLGKERVHEIIDWLVSKPDKFLRVPPIIASIIAILLIFSALPL